MKPTTRWVMRLLATGHYVPFIRALPDPGTPQGMARIGRLWDEVHDEFINRWTHDHPGTRPWVWWVFNAPERRRCLNGDHPHDRPSPDRAEAIKRHGKADVNRLRFGKPSSIFQGEFDLEYESESGYLQRLDLLTVDEAIALEHREEATPCQRRARQGRAEHHGRACRVPAGDPGRPGGGVEAEGQ